VRRILAFLAIGAAAGLAFAAAGCGASGTETPAIPNQSLRPADYTATLYRNSDYGFRMAYPKGWVTSSWTASPTPQPTDKPEFVVSFADPKGTQVKGNYVDAEQIAVYGMDKVVDKAYVQSHPDEFSALVHTLVGGLPGLAVPQDGFTTSALGDYPVFMLRYHYSIGSTVMWAESMLIAEGRYAYWVTGQTLSTTWNTKWKTMWASLATFKVTGAASPSPSATN
jgi:hypothetical protein